MKATRIVIKRPLLHYLISLAYILAPIVNILLLVFVARIRLSDILQRLFQGYGYLAGIWLLIAPIVGIGLYFVHKASCYIFLAHSALILVDYAVKWVTIPGSYWLSVRGVHQLLLLTGNVALVVVIGYIINKDFGAPYFQVLPRGWRTSRRVPIRHFVELDGRRCAISDRSDTGCFVAEPDLPLELGGKAAVSFQADVLQVACRGEVMRRTPDGYGVRFSGLSRRQKRDIRQMIRKRFPFRYAVEIPGRWVADGRPVEATVRDLSSRLLRAGGAGRDRPGADRLPAHSVGAARGEPGRHGSVAQPRGAARQAGGLRRSFRPGPAAAHAPGRRAVPQAAGGEVGQGGAGRPARFWTQI